MSNMKRNMIHHQEENLTSRFLRKKKPLILLLILAIFGALMLKACLSEPEEEVVVERENIFVEPETISFNKETNQIDVSLNTNLTPNTEVSIGLYDPENRLWGLESDFRVNKDGRVVGGLPPSYLNYPINGEYLVELSFHFENFDDFYYDKRIGGSASELEKQYADSTEVKISEFRKGTSEYKFTVSPAKPLILDNAYTSEQAKRLEHELFEKEKAEDEVAKKETSVDSTSNTSDSKYSTATGADWAKYSFDQKFIAVETILQSLKAKGYTITADTYWFINSLNAYYGNGSEPGDSEKIVSMIVLSGIAGKVLSQ